MRERFWNSFGRPMTRKKKTKSGFSYVIAVMDRIGGWFDGGEEGSKSGRRNICGKLVDQRQGDCLHWTAAHGSLQASQTEVYCGSNQLVCAYSREDNDWISEFSLVMQECKCLAILNCDIDVPCVVQCGMLRHSAPASFNNDLLNDGVILAKYNETITLAIEGFFILPSWRRNTAGSCFLWAHFLPMTGVPEALANCPKMKTMDRRTSNLMYSEKLATDKTAAPSWVLCAKWVGGRRPLLRRSKGGGEERTSHSQRKP